MSKIYHIALGGNIGNVYETFQKVLKFLSSVGYVKNSSKVYQSKPLPTYEGVEQDPYLNAVIEFETLLSAHELINKLTEIETSLGRDRSKSIHWGPRTIDLDIIYAENSIIKDEILTIPHPRLYFRDFVLVPLVELNEELIDPSIKKSIKILESELSDDHRYIEKIFAEILL